MTAAGLYTSAVVVHQGCGLVRWWCGSWVEGNSQPRVHLGFGWRVVTGERGRVQAARAPQLKECVRRQMIVWVMGWRGRDADDSAVTAAGQCNSAPVPLNVPSTPACRQVAAMEDQVQVPLPCGRQAHSS